MTKWRLTKEEYPKNNAMYVYFKLHTGVVIQGTWHKIFNLWLADSILQITFPACHVYAWCYANEYDSKED